MQARKESLYEEGWESSDIQDSQLGGHYKLKSGIPNWTGLVKSPEVKEF